jgi:hypothetical protein
MGRAGTAAPPTISDRKRSEYAELERYKKYCSRTEGGRARTPCAPRRATETAQYERGPLCSLCLPYHECGYSFCETALFSVFFRCYSDPHRVRVVLLFSKPPEGRVPVFARALVPISISDTGRLTRLPTPLE